MTNLDIRINIKNLSDYSVYLRCTVDKDTLLLMIESFSKYISNFYGSLIEDSIYSNRYKGKWEPIEDEKYIEYIGTNPVNNIVYTIKDALEVKKIGYNYIIRINPYYRYPNSNLPLIRVLRAIEYGTSDFNSRPILSRITRKLNSNIRNLWKGYLTAKGVI